MRVFPTKKTALKEMEVEPIVFRDKKESMNANYTITYRKDGKDTEPVSYETYFSE